MNNNKSALKSLRRRWFLTAVIWASVLLLTYQQLLQVWPFATRWAVVASVVLAYNLWVVWTGLPDNHRKGESALLPTFGWGNTVTLIRGLALGLFAGFLGSPWPLGALGWLPALFYSFVTIVDRFDGTLARLTNQTTELGSKLDLEFDSLGVLLVIGVAVWYGQLPWWFLPFGLTPYLFIFGLWWRKRQGLPIYELPPSTHRRVIAGFHVNALIFPLWPILPADAVTLIQLVYAIPVTLGFWRDWLVMSGYFDPDSASYRKKQRRVFTLTTKWLPPVLRLLLIITIVMIYRTIPNPLQPTEWVDLLTSWHFIFPDLIATLIIVITVFATLTTVLGIVGRLSSLLLLVPLGFHIVTQGLQWTNGLALTSVLSLMFLGTGYFSLWQITETIFIRQINDE